MKKSLKLLLVVLLIFSISALFSACGDGEEAATEQEDTKQQEDDQSTEPFAEGNLVEINFYHNGIKTPLSATDNSAVLLVDAMKDEVAAIATVESLNSDSSGKSAQELMAGYSCLELVYDQPVTLPLTQADDALTAKRILYSTHAGAGNSNILYIGEEIYQGRALGTSQNSLFAETINNYAENTVMQAVFANNQVTVAGITTEYLSAQSDDIAEPLRSWLLYNAVAFYQNSYNKNFEGNQFIITDDLDNALDMVALGAQTDNSYGEQLIFYMNNYFDYSSPSSLQVVYDGHFGDYIVYLAVDSYTMLEIIFLELNGYPYVSQCHLMSV